MKLTINLQDLTFEDVKKILTIINHRENELNKQFNKGLGAIKH